MLVGTIKKPVLRRWKDGRTADAIPGQDAYYEEEENCRDQRHDLVPATGILVAVCISATWWLVLGLVLLRGL
jgi:hypothetical protein